MARKEYVTKINSLIETTKYEITLLEHERPSDVPDAIPLESDTFE